MQKQVYIGVSALLSLTAMISPAVALDTSRSLAAVPYMVPGPTARPPAAPAASPTKIAASASEQHLQTGLKLLSSHDIDHALIEFLRAAKDNPLNVKAFYEQAVIFNQKGYAKLAQSSLQQALSIKPDYKDARVLLASIYLQSGDVSQAAGELLRSLGLTPVKATARPPLRGFGDGANAPLPQATVVQTPHGRLALPHPMSPAAADIDRLTNGQPGPTQQNKAQPDNQPSTAWLATQPTANLSAPADSVRDDNPDQQLLDKILGRVSDQTGTQAQKTSDPGAPDRQRGPTPVLQPPAPPPILEAAASQPNDNSPPGTVTKTISANNLDAQQLLKQIKTASQQKSFSWPNPFNWLKSAPAPAKAPPAARAPKKKKADKPKQLLSGAAAPKRPLAPTVQVKRFQQESHKNMVCAFFDDLFGADHAAANKHRDRIHKQPPPFNPVPAATAARAATTLKHVADDACDFIIKPQTAAPQPSTAAMQSSAPIKVPAAVPSQLSAARANDGAQVAHGIERLHLQPASHEPDGWLKHLLAFPISLFVHEKDDSLPDKASAADADWQNSAKAKQTALPGTASSTKYGKASRPLGLPLAKVDNQSARSEAIAELPPPAPATAPSNVTLPPVAALHKPAPKTLPAAAAHSSSPLVTGGINTQALHSLLQLLPPDVAESVELALLPQPAITLPETQAQKAPPAVPNERDVRTAATGAKPVITKGFSAPPLLLPKHYVLKAATPRLAPIAAQSAKPAPGSADQGDAWTKRMKYLLAYGTGSLSPGEAFMFSEETGEGIIFLPNKTTVKRKIAQPSSHETVAKLRRPDILNAQGELQYSLSLLGKLLNAPGKAAAHQSEAIKPSNSADTNFVDWLKDTFKL